MFRRNAAVVLLPPQVRLQTSVNRSRDPKINFTGAY
jgi:hypothetical protein